TVLGPGHLGVLASVGMRQVSVHRRPRVGVLSTGDELVDRPGPLALGQVRDANRPALLALCRQSGFVAVDLGRVGDRRAAVEAVLDAGGAGEAGWDALVTSGGVSMGEFDYVKAVLSERGAGGLAWVQVAIKPAKPLAFAVVGGRPVFGLPGNPVSALVSFELFARPALRQMAGFEGPARFRTVVDAVAGDDLRRRPDGKLHLVRVVASWGGDGRVHVTPSGGQSSHLLRAMALANALALLPDGDGVGAGETVQAMLLSDPR
ncbi:MAG: molybdopterin molybdotransferase MoeA, partial [Acidimicrobiales bacterium]